MDLPLIDDLRQLFVANTPMLDVRAPVEFEHGAFPNTVNIPLMNDEERRDVGIRYKEAGQEKAIELGAELVTPEKRAQRIAQWSEFVQQNPQGVLYCFRGGLRSKISQQWIYEQTGVLYPRVKGGYKAMRSFLLDELEASVADISPVVISGRTGIGKTLLLQQLKQHIDLEGIYCHRGSAFGNRAWPQPTQINVENQLSIELLRFRAQGIKQLVFEDEGANIGSRRLPESIVTMLRSAPLVLLEATPEERIEVVFDEYVTQALADFEQVLGNPQKAFSAWAEHMLDSLARIERRLGGVRFVTMRDGLKAAIDLHRHQGDTRLYHDWIHSLLVDYYDPMYDYQLSKKQDRIVFRGTVEDIRDYLGTQFSIC